MNLAVFKYAKRYIFPVNPQGKVAKVYQKMEKSRHPVWIIVDLKLFIKRQGVRYPRSNVFAAWFFMPQTIAMGWVAAAGRMLLEILGVATIEGDIPGRLVGALLLFLLVFLVWYFMRGLPPEGKVGGNGYRFGHKLVLAGNMMAAALFMFHFLAPGIEGQNMHLVLEKFTTAFGYMCMACFAGGFSFIYQSSLPQEKNS
ncbi:MAG: hypothetical protein WC298_03325 [Sideroxydans sp.]|jgi:hypothetical protein